MTIDLLHGKQTAMRRLIAFSFGLVFALSSGVWAFSQQAPGPSGKLPTAKEILDRYVQALGGREALQNIKSITTRNQIDIPSTKLRWTSISYSKLFKRLNKTSFPGEAETSWGYDGKVAWRIDPQGGARIFEGKTVDSIRRDSDIYYPLHESDYFRIYEAVGIEQFAGHECYHIKGTTNWGKENNQYYDTGSGLLVGYRFASDSGDDPVMNIELFDDYKSFGGPLVPTRITVKHGDEVERIISVTSVSYADLDDSIFSLPDSVKKLMNK